MSTTLHTAPAPANTYVLFWRACDVKTISERLPPPPWTATIRRSCFHHQSRTRQPTLSPYPRPLTTDVPRFLPNSSTNTLVIRTYFLCSLSYQTIVFCVHRSSFIGKYTRNTSFTRRYMFRAYLNNRWSDPPLPITETVSVFSSGIT